MLLLYSYYLASQESIVKNRISKFGRSLFEMISILVHTISGDENRNQLEKATFRSNFEKWFLQSIPERPKNVSTEDTNSKKKIEKFYTIAYSVKLTITSPTLELFPKLTFFKVVNIHLAGVGIIHFISRSTDSACNSVNICIYYLSGCCFIDQKILEILSR